MTIFSLNVRNLLDKSMTTQGLIDLSDRGLVGERQYRHGSLAGTLLHIKNSSEKLFSTVFSLTKRATESSNSTKRDLSNKILSAMEYVNIAKMSDFKIISDSFIQYCATVKQPLILPILEGMKTAILNTIQLIEKASELNLHLYSKNRLDNVKLELITLMILIYECDYDNMDMEDIKAQFDYINTEISLLNSLFKISTPKCEMKADG